MKISELINVDTLKYNWDKIWSIPEFAILKETPQSKRWHSEGNVDKHTMLVCQAAQAIVRNSNNYSINECYYTYKYNRLLLLAAALFHDIGKGVTTVEKKGDWHSYGHELMSEKITRRLLWDENFKIREDICALVKYHMQPLFVLTSKNPYDEIVNLSNLVFNWMILLDLKRCDLRGSLQEDAVGKDGDFEILNILEAIITNLGLYKSCDKSLIMSTKLTKKINDKKSRLPQIRVNVMVGLPGSGKSSYILQNKKDGDVVVSRDSIRVELGFCTEDEKIIGTPEQEEEVTKEFNKRILDAAKAGKTIWIDNLNIKKKYRNDYKNLLKDYDVYWQYIYVETSLKNNIARRDGQIPEGAFNGMINNFDYPTPDEYSSLFVFINGKD